MRPPRKKKKKKKKKKVRQPFPQGTKLHTSPQGTKNIWKMPMKKRRPRTQLLLHQTFLAMIMIAGLSIVIETTRRPHGIGRGQNGIESAVKADAKERANKEAKAISKRAVQE